MTVKFRYKPTEYDMVTGGILGNFNFIKDRYPTDKILIKRIQVLATLCLHLGALCGFDEEDFKRLNEELRGNRA
jgi:hypothetical protein